MFELSAIMNWNYSGIVMDSIQWILRNQKVGNAGARSSFISFTTTTPALIVIAQTELDLNDGEIKRNSPFEKNGHSDMCHYISDPDPAQLGNLKGGADSKAEPKGDPIEKQFITAGKVKFRDTNPYPKGADPSGVIKWALVALCDGGKEFCAVDPTIKLEA